jgi:hypothetical protein
MVKLQSEQEHCCGSYSMSLLIVISLSFAWACGSDLPEDKHNDITIVDLNGRPATDTQPPNSNNGVDASVSTDTGIDTQTPDGRDTGTRPGDAGSDTTTPDTGMDAEPDGPTACEGTGFARDGSSWAIPYPANLFANNFHTVMDLDGDGKADFVQFDGEESANDMAIGVTRWNVYRNTGSGFASQPTSWTIPYPADYFANNFHTVMDLDGDGKADFVQFDGEESANDMAIGVTRWNVYRNTGSGFASQPTSWAIPYPADYFANNFHTVMDLDGDGKADFVQFDGEESANDMAIGVTRWNVYRNTGSGFASQPTQWSIPYPADYLANNFHTVMDLDGDGKADFVQFDGEESADDAAIGVTRWNVYRNTGSGFASQPTSWTIPYPADYLANNFHTVADFDRDGKLDFVQFDGEETSTDPAIGMTQWRIYRNTGSGFVSTGAAWTLPYPADDFANALHLVLDLDRDGMPDFVQYDGEPPVEDTSIGSTEWRVYAGTCSR